MIISMYDDLFKKKKENKGECNERKQKKKFKTLGGVKGENKTKKKKELNGVRREVREW